MNKIEVPDWVVDAAVDEIRLAKHTCFDRWTDQQAMRAALTAALGAWVETAGYVHPDTIEGLRAGLSSKSFLFAKPLPQIWADIPLYLLRQEKPE